MGEYYKAYEEYLQQMHSRRAVDPTYQTPSFEEWLEEDDEMINADPGEMDGDFDSAMASAGFGTDEDYNHYEYEGDH